MMKKFLSLSISLALSVWAIGQTGWIQVDVDLDPGRKVGQISDGMNDPTALWAMAVDGTTAIVDEYTRSIDGGLTWNQGSFNAGTGLSQLFAIDANTCWAVFNTGASQGLYKTVNGGTTWIKKGTAYGASSFANIMHFFNDNDGVAMGDPLGGYYEIYTTTDGGETWTRVPQANIPAPTAGEYGITGNYCASGDHIWFGTNQGRIFHSANKGVNWTAALTVFGNVETVIPEFADPLNGIAYRSYLNMGIEPVLNVTTDGGATWTELFVTGDMYARYIEYVPGTVETYVGSSSEAGANGISYSYDGGTTWTTITAGYDFGASAWSDNEDGLAGGTVATNGTGGMYIYDGDPLGPVVANFEANVTAIELGDQVIFTDLSTGSPTSWAWVFEGGSPGTSYLQTPPAITYSTPGLWDVTLVVSNVNGSDTLTIPDYIYVGGVGINDHSSATVTIFPNPVSDVLNINGTETIQELQVLNLVGQVVYNQKVDNTTVVLNLDNLKAGVYNLRIKMADGCVNKKIIVN
ncbi:MAG: T9SS type A sorting domain-containing protein [bacterium]